MDHHELMKQYYERRAPEYGRSIPGVGEAAPYKEIVENWPALLRAISGLPPARVLDVGCGTGFLTQHLGGEVVGLDQSAAMLDIARGRVPWADFVRGDALNMPFAEGSFDRVFSSNFYGSRHMIYRRYFTAEGLAEELGGRILFAGRWFVMAAARV